MKVNSITRLILGSILVIFCSPTSPNSVSSLSLSGERAKRSQVAREKRPGKLLVRDRLINKPNSAPVLRIRGRTNASVAPGEHHLPEFNRLPDVSVTCSSSSFVLRVKKSFYGFSVVPEELTLGDTCKSNGVLEAQNVILFTYALTDCQSEQQVFPDYLVHKYVLRFIPKSHGDSHRNHRVNVGVECHYKRDANSLVEMPTQRTLLHKIIRSRSGDFQIQLMDNSWSSPVRSAVYMLGQMVNVQVSSRHHYRGTKLFINSCYAAAVNSMNEAKKYNLIDNHGCLQESRINPGTSRFWFPRADNVIQFSFGAFQFTEAPDAQISLHCDLVVSGGTSSSMQKACFYSHTDKRWISVFGQDSVCECCDSVCNQTKSKQIIYEGFVSSDQVFFSDPLDSTRLTDVNDDIWFEAKSAKEHVSSYTHNDFVASVTFLSSEEDYYTRKHKLHTSKVKVVEKRKETEEDKHGDVEIFMAVSGGSERADLDQIEGFDAASGDGMIQDMIQSFWKRKDQNVEEVYQEGRGFMKIPELVNTTMEKHFQRDDSGLNKAQPYTKFPSFFFSDDTKDEISSDKKEEVLDLKFPVGSDELVEQGVVRKLDVKQDYDEYYFSDMGAILKD